MSVRLAPALAGVADVTDVGMALPEVLCKVAVGDPDEAGLLALLGLARELVAHAGHHAGEERPAIAIAADAELRLVLAPQALRRRDEVAVDVLRDLDVLDAPADLEDAPALALACPIDRDPDRLDEEVLAEEEREHALGLGRAPGRRAEVLPDVALRGPRVPELDVVLEQQPLRRRHRRLRLVDVGALGEGEQPRDAVADPALLFGSLGRRSVRCAGGRAVDAEPIAYGAERRTVRGLAALGQHLADVLMRHLVLEHLDDDTPRFRENERTRQLDRARRLDPPAKARAGGHELDLRELQRALEVREGEEAILLAELVEERPSSAAERRGASSSSLFARPD